MIVFRSWARTFAKVDSVKPEFRAVVPPTVGRNLGDRSANDKVSHEDNVEVTAVMVGRTRFMALLAQEGFAGMVVPPVVIPSLPTRPPPLPAVSSQAGQGAAGPDTVI